MILPGTVRRRGLGEVAGVDVGATEHDRQTLPRIGTLGVQDAMNLGGNSLLRCRDERRMVRWIATTANVTWWPPVHWPPPVLERCDAPTARRR